MPPEVLRLTTLTAAAGSRRRAGTATWQAQNEVAALLFTTNQHIDAHLFADRIRALCISELLHSIIEETNRWTSPPSHGVITGTGTAEVEVALYLLAVAVGEGGACGAWLEGLDSWEQKEDVGNITSNTST